MWLLVTQGDDDDDIYNNNSRGNKDITKVQVCFTYSFCQSEFPVCRCGTFNICLIKQDLQRGMVDPNLLRVQIYDSLDCPDCPGCPDCPVEILISS